MSRATTRIEIDPNIRVRNNVTYAGFEDVDGYIAPGWDVEVYEPEAGLVGSGLVTEIDTDRRLVYVSVDWRSLRFEHKDRGDGWCGLCGCAYECPGSVVPTPVEPVSLTRGGFMLGR